MHAVLILGAGLVAKPMVEYLLGNAITVMIASPMMERANAMIKGNPLGEAVYWSMDDQETLCKMVSEHDITVSLLPYKYHADIAKVCLKNRKPLVTTSYIQPGMDLMKDDVRKAGVIFLNEIGLDPGIDHMSAMRIIDHIHGKGGKVEEFYSLCGALPAPEAAGNPLRYKFSWSPKGVILASRNGALYLKKGQRVEVEPENLFRDRFTCNFPGAGDLEVYPNRDSISYIDIYGIPEVKTMYRGTFRYKGWCETLDVMKRLHMLDDKVMEYQGMTFATFLAERAGIENKNLKERIASGMHIPVNSDPIRSLEFLDFFSDKHLEYEGATTPFEVTSDQMIKKMMMADDERDMVIMQHLFHACYPDGKREVIRSLMSDYGTPSANTAIAKTVALPAAIAVRMILEKRINLAGIYRPVIPEIYNPVLNELKTLGIGMKEEFNLPESTSL